MNRVLDRTEEVEGSIGRIEANLWRGAYEIEHVDLVKVTSVSEEPLLQIGRIDLSLDRSSLLRGELVGEVGLVEPRFVVVLAPADEEAQTGTEVDWREHLDRLFPFRIERLVAAGGRIDVIDLRRRPPTDVWVEDVQVLVANLSNTPDDRDRELPSSALVTGRPFGHAWLRIAIDFDPLAEPPEFDLDLALEDVDLPELNDLLVAYFGVDAEDGKFHLFAELAARDGRIEGYVKPFFEDLQVASWGDVDDPAKALEALWEGFVQAAAEVLERGPHDRLATRVPISGAIQRPQAGLWTTVAELLRHAFVEALSPVLEGTVGIEDVGAEADA